MEALLLAFSYLIDVQGMGDEAALRNLLELLQRQDMEMFGTKEGPSLLAMLRWFGLVAPHTGQHRLDSLEPELVCKVLVEFEKLKLKLIEYQSKNNFSKPRWLGDRTDYERLQPTQPIKEI